MTEPGKRFQFSFEINVIQILAIVIFFSIGWGIWTARQEGSESEHKRIFDQVQAMTDRQGNSMQMLSRETALLEDLQQRVTRLEDKEYGRK